MGSRCPSLVIDKQPSGRKVLNRTVLMEFVEIGKLNKPHGLQGELKATVDERYWEDLARVAAIFVDQKGDKIPYFIETVRGGEPLIFKLEEVNTKEEAALLTNKPLYLRREDVHLDDAAIRSKGLEHDYLEGYTLSVEEVGEIGPIQSVDEYPQQEMALVQYQGREVLIPLREAWIIAVDRSTKTVLMNLPDGLLDL